VQVMEKEGKERRGHTLARWPVPTIPTLPPAFSIVSVDISQRISLSRCEVEEVVMEVRSGDRLYIVLQGGLVGGSAPE
jgi:hypothetical protein